LLLWRRNHLRGSIFAGRRAIGRHRRNRAVIDGWWGAGEASNAIAHAIAATNALQFARVDREFDERSQVFVGARDDAVTAAIA
jgi:hypothetical protein